MAFMIGTIKIVSNMEESPKSIDKKLHAIRVSKPLQDIISDKRNDTKFSKKDDVKSGRMAITFCYNCNESGHLKIDCPKETVTEKRRAQSGKGKKSKMHSWKDQKDKKRINSNIGSVAGLVTS